MAYTYDRFREDDEDSFRMAGNEFGDHVERATFDQILEMDEESHDFSMPLVLNFFEQADETFAKMDVAVASKDLAELSRLGHFLKGSSATLGFTRIKDNCQIIQQYGSNLTVDGNPEPDQKICLNKIKDALESVKVNKKHLEKEMNNFFYPSK